MQRIVMHRMARLTRGLCLVLGLLGAFSAAGETRNFSGGLTLQKYGSGEMRRFGFLVYEAQLWAAANPSDPPIARYRRCQNRRCQRRSDASARR